MYRFLGFCTQLLLLFKPLLFFFITFYLIRAKKVISSFTSFCFFLIFIGLNWWNLAILVQTKPMSSVVVCLSDNMKNKLHTGEFTIYVCPGVSSNFNLGRLSCTYSPPRYQLVVSRKYKIILHSFTVSTTMHIFSPWE